MKIKLSRIAKDTNLFLKNFFNNQHNSKLIPAMKYGLFPGGKKIRSKILIDIGSLLSINYKTLIAIGAAVECIHAYSLIHDDLPCMDNDKMRRGKPSTHIKFGESTAVLAGNSLLTLAYEILSDKNLPPDIDTRSIEELTDEANQIIESLENEKDLNNSVESYQQLLKLNNIIEKKFKKNLKSISEEPNKKVREIIKKK